MTTTITSVYAYGYLIWVGIYDAYLFFILLFGWKQANLLNYWQYKTMSNQIDTTNKKVIGNFYFWIKLPKVKMLNYEHFDNVDWYVIK